MRDIFNTWKVTLFATLIIIVLSLLNVFLNYLLVECIFIFGTIAAFLLILFNLVFLLIKRKWIHTLASFGILLVCTVFLFVYSFSMFWVYQSRSDKFADDLEIPKDIDLNTPQQLFFFEENRDSIMRSKIDFDLYISSQSGLYEYDFWIGKIDSGTVYLKAFEITHNYQLSKESLIEESSVSVYNSIDSIVRFGTEGHFTIYEGDWGKPYAARFELWYKSKNENLDKKLIEKTYKIEGWQR